MNDDPSFQSEPSKTPVRSRFNCLCTVVRLVALALVFVVFVAQDRENSESSSPQGREVSRSRLVVVTALSAIIADKIFGAFRRRRKRIRRAEKEEPERHRDQ